MSALDRQICLVLPLRCDLIGIRKHRRMAKKKTSCIMDRIGWVWPVSHLRMLRFEAARRKKIERECLFRILIRSCESGLPIRMRWKGANIYRLLLVLLIRLIGQRAAHQRHISVTLSAVLASRRMLTNSIRSNALAKEDIGCRLCSQIRFDGSSDSNDIIHWQFGQQQWQYTVKNNTKKFLKN